MKRLLVLIFFLTLSTGLLTAPLPVGLLGDDLDKMMQVTYPNWWNWAPEHRETVRSLFQSSVDKHDWFPDVYLERKRHFMIYPESQKLKL